MDEIIVNTKKQISPNNILFFKADVNYTTVYYIDGKKEILVKSLKYIESQLNHNNFYRIHKSYVVNLQYVSSKSIGVILELQDNYNLSVSRRKLSGLRKILKKTNLNHQL